MSQPDYDDPYNQRVGGADTPEARHWDKLWIALEESQGPWEQRPAGRAHFIESMKRLSSVLAQDKRFSKLSAKHAVFDLLRYIKVDGLLLLNEEREFDEEYPNKRLSITYIPGMDWRFFSQLIVHSLLAPVGALDSATTVDKSRFDALERQADQVDGIVAYAHFINRLLELIWDDDIIERVTAKTFVDAMVNVAEGRAEGISIPDPEPDWRLIEPNIRGAIWTGNASVTPPSEFD
ncbi:MAG: hypothetical protein QNJ92_18465 [Alphaproteobacteria bacterium]|nr:hypothetical protein [Alphaproteobacteria bacterium]